MTDQYVTRAALARWLTGIPLTKCRVTVKTKPRDVVLNDKRNGTPGQKPSHFIVHDDRDKNIAFLWIFTFKKTASQSFRYLSLSLQNGVLRNQGDTGTQALPTIKLCPITTQEALLMARPRYHVGQSQNLASSQQAYSSMSRREDPQKGLSNLKNTEIKLQSKNDSGNVKECKCKLHPNILLIEFKRALEGYKHPLLVYFWASSWV